VARLALAGRRFVEDHLFPIDFASQFVTVVTDDVAMRALKGKWSAFVVIEFARLPPRRIVATGAIGCVFAGGKLATMGVGMATGALFGSGAEIDIFQVRF
jgi:hypothetical protein